MPGNIAVIVALAWFGPRQFATNRRPRLVNALRWIAFLEIPSAVAFMALGDVIAATIYRSGKFTQADSLYERGILAGSGVKLLASAQRRISPLFTRGNTLEHRCESPWSIILTTVLGYFCALPLPPMLVGRGHYCFRPRLGIKLRFRPALSSVRVIDLLLAEGGNIRARFH